MTRATSESHIDYNGVFFRLDAMPPKTSLVVQSRWRKREPDAASLRLVLSSSSFSSLVAFSYQNSEDRRAPSDTSCHLLLSRL